MDYMETIMGFFQEKGKGEGLTVDTDLFGGGFVNSLFAFEIVLFLEDTFKLKIKSREINESNFRSIRHIAGVVERLKG